MRIGIFHVLNRSQASEFMIPVLLSWFPVHVGQIAQNSQKKKKKNSRVLKHFIFFWPYEFDSLNFCVSLHPFMKSGVVCLPNSYVV